MDTMHTTPWVEYHERGERLRIRARYGFDLAFAHKHTQAPHFSVTAEIERFDCYHWKEDAGGCLHDAAAKHFPTLAPLIRWHLVAWPGVPMHYAENGAYWLSYVLDCNAWPREAYMRDKPIDNFMGTVVWGAVEGDTPEILAELTKPISVTQPDGVIWEQYAKSEEGQKEQRLKLELRVRTWALRRMQALADALRRDLLASGLFSESALAAVTQATQEINLKREECFLQSRAQGEKPAGR